MHAVGLQLFPLFIYVNNIKQDLEIKSGVNFLPE